MPHAPYKLAGHRPRAFTLVELLTASAITALVAAAAAALIFAIGDASAQTRDLRETKTAGHYALGRIEAAIRSARAIGVVTPTSITLWTADTNGDDVLNVKEVGGIWYDGTTKRITYVSLPNSTDTSPVILSSFINPTNVGTLLTSLGNKTVVWAEGVESLTFTGYPNNTDTRIVDTAFTIGTGVDAVVFRIAASPRASADYLYVSTAQGPALPGSTRIRRIKTSPFNGLNAAAMPTP
jgi:prepilin-type N-terminal cleavage/methylation domain-containing protein